MVFATVDTDVVFQSVPFVPCATPLEQQLRDQAMTVRIQCSYVACHRALTLVLARCLSLSVCICLEEVACGRFQIKTHKKERYYHYYYYYF